MPVGGGGNIALGTKARNWILLHLPTPPLPTHIDALQHNILSDLPIDNSSQRQRHSAPVCTMCFRVVEPAACF